MFKLLKKIIVKNNTETKDNSTILKISNLAYQKDLQQLFYSPVNKLYVLNTYTDSFNDLLTNLANKSFHRPLIAVNIHSYFNNSTDDIQYNLNRIAKYMQTNTINILLENDLLEIVSAFEYLTENKEKYGQ